METKFQAPHCPECNSRNVACDATARWDSLLGAFYVSGTQDGRWTCQDCERETPFPVWKDVPGEQLVVENLLEVLDRNEFDVVGVDDEEGSLWDGKEDLVAAIMSVEACRVVVRKRGAKKRYGISLVFGNAPDGSELIADYSAPHDDADGFVAMMGELC